MMIVRSSLINPSLLHSVTWITEMRLSLDKLGLLSRHVMIGWTPVSYNKVLTVTLDGNRNKEKWRSLLSTCWELGAIYLLSFCYNSVSVTLLHQCLWMKESETDQGKVPEGTEPAPRGVGLRENWHHSAHSFPSTCEKMGWERGSGSVPGPTAGIQA